MRSEANPGARGSGGLPSGGERAPFPGVQGPDGRRPGRPWTPGNVTAERKWAATPGRARMHVRTWMVEPGSSGPRRVCRAAANARPSPAPRAPTAAGPVDHGPRG
eukprot:8272725-Alexandrium_andersonii.AAC.1